MHREVIPKCPFPLTNRILMWIRKDTHTYTYVRTYIRMHATHQELCMYVFVYSIYYISNIITT